TPVTQEGTSADRQVARAERLAREGKSTEAAALYESLAAQSPKELRNRLLLRAAREHVRAGDIGNASTLLKQVDTTLPSVDFALRAQVAAELALASNRPEAALTELNRIPQPPPRSELSDILA